MKFKDLKPGQAFKFVGDESILFKSRGYLNDSDFAYYGRGWSSSESINSKRYDEREVIPLEIKAEPKKLTFSDLPLMQKFSYVADINKGCKISYIKVKDGCKYKALQDNGNIVEALLDFEVKAID